VTKKSRFIYIIYFIRCSKLWCQFSSVCERCTRWLVWL